MTAMDEHRAPFRLQAPARGGSSLRLPGRDSFPSLEDHLVQPEVTRDEVIGGRRVVASPAHPPHAQRHGRLGYVLGALVASGYVLALDQLTRWDEDSDFASDACIYKDGIDPATGVRHLEEIAFEVVSEQSARNVTEKAERMHRRGVRRIFGVWVKGVSRVCEWSPQTRSWSPLSPESQIEDRCMVAPLTVAALLDAASAESAVVEALAAKGSPALLSRESAAQARGVTEGMAAGAAASLLRILEARGLSVSGAQREEILRCRDLERLNRWLQRAVLASRTDEILAEH
jgi:hypothetical protein